MTVWTIPIMVCQNCGLANYSGGNICLNCNHITIPVILKTDDECEEVKRDVDDGCCRQDM